MTKKLEINFTKKPEMVFQFDQFLNVEQAVDKFLNKKENLERLIAPLIPINLEETIKKLIPEVEDWKTPIKWIDYDDGEDGKDWETPTDEKIISLIKPQIPEPIPWKDGKTPKKGVDYFTKKELEDIKKGLKEAIMSEMTNHVTKEEVNIRLEEIKKQVNSLPQSGGAQFLRQLMDVNVWVPTAQQYGLTYNPQRSEFSLTAITGGGAVDSVNWQTWVVVLDTGDIAEATDANYVSDAQLTVIGNTSGTNTGDQDLSPYFNKSVDDTDDITVGSTNKFATAAEKTKLSNITVTQAVDLDQMEIDIAALANGMVYKGNWDASAGTFPGAWAAQTGWFYTVSVGGTVDSVVFNVDDRLVATTDNASATVYAGNWTKLDATDAVTSVFGRTGNVTATSWDYNAGQITNTPAGNISATDVQAAINELDTEKQPLDTQLTSLAGLSYSSNALKVVRVNAWETDFELATISSSGATTALDNLSGVAINTSLISDTNNTDDLWSTGIRWRKSWVVDAESTNTPTVWGTPILSSLTAPQFTTIELWHASDTTLSRVSAGVVAVEWKTLANLTDGGTFLADISVPDEAYGSGWNGSVEVPTKNAVYDKIQTLANPTATVIVPMPTQWINGAATARTYNTNTKGYCISYDIHATIVVTSIDVRASGAAAVNGTLDMGIYSEDGQTKLIDVTTGTISSSAVYHTAVSSVTLTPWRYYLVVVPNGTANVELNGWTIFGVNLADTGEPVLCWTLTVTASTLPTTFTPSSITFSSSEMWPFIRLNA